VNQRKQ